jgi:hypothetical protein
MIPLSGGWFDFGALRPAGADHSGAKVDPAAARSPAKTFTV